MKSENALIFVGFAPVFLWASALAVALFVVCLVVASLVLFALLLLFVCFACAGCVGCVVGSFLSLSDKTKNGAHLLRSVFAWFWCLYSKLSNAIIAFL